MEKIIHKDLSFDLNGVFFEVFNCLGPGFKEKYYCQAVNKLFVEKGINFIYQYKMPLEIQGQIFSRRYFDYLIEDKIIVEVKVGNKPSGRDFDQIKEYLRISGLMLGLLVLFRDKDVKVYRVLNPDYK